MLFPVLSNLSKQRRPASVFDMMSQFDEAFRQIGVLNSDTSWPAVDFSPFIDVEEKEGVWHITADLPGMRKEDVKVEFHDGVLTISGERVKESKGEAKYYERTYGKFLRSFRLPQPVDIEKIEAKYENGVLHLAIPTLESVKTKAIKIK